MLLDETYVSADNPFGVEPGWRSKAECQSIPTEQMFLDGGGRYPVIVKEVCDGCPVIASCLGVAYEHEAGEKPQNVFGYAGGMTAKERLALFARLDAAA